MKKRHSRGASNNLLDVYIQMAPDGKYPPEPQSRDLLHKDPTYNQVWVGASNSDTHQCLCCSVFPFQSFTSNLLNLAARYISAIAITWCDLFFNWSISKLVIFSRTHIFRFAANVWIWLNLWFPLKTESSAETVVHECPWHLDLHLIIWVCSVFFNRGSYHLL